MKKSILSTLLVSTLLLAACQNETTSSDESSDESSDKTTEEATEQVSEQEVASEETSDENEDAAEDEETEEEEVAFQYQINPNTFAVEPIDGETAEDEKLVLLTFDDAPYGNSLEIADALEERGVNAIFFVNSMYMDEEGTEVVQELHSRGFEIANHTHTHATLPDYSPETQREEIVTTNDMIEEAIGERPRFFRAPHGMMTDYSEQVVAEEGMSWMNWSFGFDWQVEYQDSAALADITLNTELLGNGTNILMHDRDWTAGAVPEIVDGLIEQGFTIVDPKLITHE